MSLAIVTVLYRSREMLAKTLPTWVRSAEGLPVQFVFVDHTPDDGCPEVIADCLAASRYQYLPDPANPGFAAGCNRGVGAASASHVLLLNPDVWLPDDALPAVDRAIAEAPEQPIAVGLAMHGREYAGVDLHPLSLFIDRAADRRRGPLGPSGGAAVFPTGLFQRHGGFFEHLFAWGEDADLAFRLYAAGVRTRSLPLALPHAWGHSVDGDAALTAFRAYLLARNRVLVAARTFTGPLLAAAAALMAVAHLGLAVRRVRQGTLRPFLRGVARGLRESRSQRRAGPGPRFGIRCLVRYLRSGGK